MIPDGSMDLHKGMVSATSSKYKAFFSTLKYNCLNLKRIMMYCDVYNI